LDDEEALLPDAEETDETFIKTPPENDFVSIFGR
jgi:hypothetical protein